MHLERDYEKEASLGLEKLGSKMRPLFLFNK